MMEHTNQYIRKKVVQKNAIYLEHGKPMLFGVDKEYGLMQEGFGLKVVKLGENGVTEKRHFSARCSLYG